MWLRVQVSEQVCLPGVLGHELVGPVPVQLERSHKFSLQRVRVEPRDLFCAGPLLRFTLHAAGTLNSYGKKGRRERGERERWGEKERDGGGGGRVR